METNYCIKSVAPSQPELYTSVQVGKWIFEPIHGILFDIRCAFLRKVSIYIQKKFTIYQPAPEPPTGLRWPVKDGYVLPGRINFVSQNGQSGLLNINAHIVHFSSSSNVYINTTLTSQQQTLYLHDFKTIGIYSKRLWLLQLIWCVIWVVELFSTYMYKPRLTIFLKNLLMVSS